MRKKEKKKKRQDPKSASTEVHRMFGVEDSSIIEAIGYCYVTSVLHVRFKSTGVTYAYENVTLLHWAQLCNHVSVGEALSVIRKHKKQFPYQKL